MLEISNPYALRIEIDPGRIYALVVSESSPVPGPDVKSFYLINTEYGDPVFMFSCETESDEISFDLVRLNYIVYIPEEWE